MFDGIPITTLTPAALLGICVLLLFLGKLVPRSTLVDKAKECEDWKKAYEAERDARAIESAQKAELLEITRTTRDILDAMFNASYGRHRDSGGPYAASVEK